MESHELVLLAFLVVTAIPLLLLELGMRRVRRARHDGGRPNSGR